MTAGATVSACYFYRGGRRCSRSGHWHCYSGGRGRGCGVPHARTWYVVCPDFGQCSRPALALPGLVPPPQDGYTPRTSTRAAATLSLGPIASHPTDSYSLHRLPARAPGLVRREYCWADETRLVIPRALILYFWRFKAFTLNQARCT